MSANPLEDIVHELAKVPGIGRKSAQRMAFHLLSLPTSEVDQLIEAMIRLRDDVKYCQQCFHITKNDDLCDICQQPFRDSSQLCIVSDSKDLLALEGMGKFQGLYHILGGVISPLDGIGPEQLRVRELIERLKNNNVEEIVFALTPSVEGETTTLYLKKLIRPLGIKLTQLAYGIPVGSDLEWADQVTLSKAFEGRRNLGA